jgi:enoyl-CoA hydratase/carnithine racemase
MEKLQEVTMECAKKLASKAPLAVKTIKSVINRGIELPLEEALKLEREGLVALMQTEDFKEGVRAFFERRQPQWKGR